MPRKAVETDVRRYALNMKTTAKLRQRLEDRAEQNGRVLTHEVEHQLIKSFELEEQIALQGEIKSEMRGTITALERRIALMKEGEDMLWPDASARALGRVFAMALTGARHAGGKDWREDPAAPVIVAGVVRRVMDRCSRNNGSMVAALFDRERIASTTEAIATSLADFVDKVMPPLPPLQPQDDPANWTNNARRAVTFRDKASGELLQVISTAEYDIADPENRPEFGPDYRATLDRFRAKRDTIDVEDFIVFALKDGSSAWESLSRRGSKVRVPAGQDAPSPEPATRFATPDELADMVPARGQLPPSIGDQAIYDEAVAGLPLVKAEREAERKAKAPAPTRGRKIKVATEVFPSRQAAQKETLTMSRGPGRIERAIEDAFRSQPSNTFSTEELVSLAYPGVNRVEKKHRVAVIRAADKVMQRLLWQGWKSERPGKMTVYLNPLDVRSYSVGRLRSSYGTADKPVCEIERILDDPTVHRSRWDRVQPGGAWWQHVEIAKARRDDRNDEADAMAAELNSIVSKHLRALR